MNNTTIKRTLWVLGLGLTFSACKKNEVKQENTMTNTSVIQQTIGVQGGMIRHPDGAVLEIPAGAVEREHKFSIDSYNASQTSDGNYPDFPSGISNATNNNRVFRYEPANLPLFAPVRLTIPVADSSTPPTLFACEDELNWNAIAPDTVNRTELVFLRSRLGLFFAGKGDMMMNMETCPTAPDPNDSKLGSATITGGPAPTDVVATIEDGVSVDGNPTKTLTIRFTNYADACFTVEQAIDRIGGQGGTLVFYREGLAGDSMPPPFRSGMYSYTGPGLEDGGGFNFDIRAGTFTNGSDGTCPAPEQQAGGGSGPITLNLTEVLEGTEASLSGDFNVQGGPSGSFTAPICSPQITRTMDCCMPAGGT